MGIAHHSAYVVWLEAARVEWLRDRGISYRQMEEEGISLAVSRVSIDYRRAVHFDDLVHIEATMTEARTRRFAFDYTIYRDGEERPVALGSTVHVPTDRSGRAVRLPSDWFGRLQAVIGEDPKGTL